MQLSGDLLSLLPPEWVHDLGFCPVEETQLAIQKNN